MEAVCPKCGAPRAAEACPKCGLIYDKFSPEALDREVPSRLREMWQSVETSWENPAAHDVFIEQAARAEQLGFAARLYMRHKNDAIATAQRERIIQRMEVAMMASSARRPTYKWGKMVTIVLLLIVLAMALFVLVSSGRSR